MSLVLIGCRWVLLLGWLLLVVVGCCWLLLVVVGCCLFCVEIGGREQGEEEEKDGSGGGEVQQ